MIAISRQNNTAQHCCVFGMGNLLLGFVNNIKEYHDNKPWIKNNSKATTLFLLKISDVSIYF